MDHIDVGFAIGAVLGAFLISRLFLLLLRPLKLGLSRFWVANALALATSTGIGGWGFSNNFDGQYVPLYAFSIYAPAQLVVLLADLWWQARKKNA